MKKLKFNSDLFTVFPSSDNDQIAFVFDKKKGDIFQVEGVTKEIIFEFLNKPSEEEKIKNKFIKSYKMSSEDVSNFEDFFSKIKKKKIII